MTADQLSLDTPQTPGTSTPPVVGVPGPPSDARVTEAPSADTAAPATREGPGAAAPLVIGIDPSLTGTGIVTADVMLTVTETKHYPGDQRLDRIHLGVVVHATGHQLAVVEDLPTGAHGAGKTGMAQGVVRLALIQQEVPYVLITAATLKTFATGKGNATKPDMRMALYQRAAIDLRDDNQVDAWWLRALGRHLLGAPLLDLPKTHLRALDKVTWPVTA